jgi:thiaminase/transcriptional activator TenA
VSSLDAASHLFADLKASCREDWAAYVGHDFVRQLGAGRLPEACFRHYLTQDYLFLIHFARAYGLAVFKSDRLAEMRSAAATLSALINQEMALHLRYCATWDLDEVAMAAVPEAEANLAYTRFVLERGLAGDLLDLLVALAPCVLGYAEIGASLQAESGSAREDNPYREWIETYGGADYQDVARAAAGELDAVAARMIGPDHRAAPRWPALARTFRTATRLEIGFWQMGLAPPE